MGNQEIRPGQNTSREQAPYANWPAEKADEYIVEGEVKRRFDVTTPTGVWGITANSPEEARVKAYEMNDAALRYLSNQSRPVLELRPAGSLSPDSLYTESVEEYGMFGSLRYIILGKIYRVSVFRAYTPQQKEITREEGAYEVIVEARFRNSKEAVKVGQRTLARLLENEKARSDSS